MNYKDCKDLAGDWDMQAVLTQTHYVCKNCKKPIEEKFKRPMVMAGEWKATNPQPMPGHVSQHISDLYSFHAQVSWGKLALKCIAASRGPISERQGFWNHNLGLPWEEQASKVEEEDVLKLRADYVRGTIPKKPYVLMLASDIGLEHAKWMVMAFAEDGESWVVDWGEELSPDGVLPLLLKDWHCSEDGKNYRVGYAFMDGKYRKEMVYEACLKSGGVMWPVAGAGDSGTRQSIAFGQIPGQPQWFGLITFNDRDFKHMLYVDRIKLKKNPALHLPNKIDEVLLTEWQNENLLHKPTAHSSREHEWKRKGANHLGDTAKVCLMGWTYLTREKRLAAGNPPATEVPA
jgi:hypothetical protein